MTKVQLLSMARQHALDHPGLATVVFRCVCYATIQMISMTVATQFFNDTYVANSCMFVILMSAFELLWSISHCGARRLGYVFAVFGMSVSGFFLLQQAISYNQSCEGSQTVQTSRK